jgi:hypothetical protein
MDGELLLGIEPAHVFGLLMAGVVGLFGFMMKINRCIGRLEGMLEIHLKTQK